MTREQFIADYCKRSGISWNILKEITVALPCACGEDGCEGWAMVPDSPESIKTHMELYAPNDAEPNAK